MLTHVTFSIVNIFSLPRQFCGAFVRFQDVNAQKRKQFNFITSAFYTDEQSSSLKAIKWILGDLKATLKN